MHEHVGGVDAQPLHRQEVGEVRHRQHARRHEGEQDWLEGERLGVVVRPPRDPHVQGRQQQHRGVEVEDGRDGGAQRPQPGGQVPGPTHPRRDGLEEPDVVEQRRQRHRQQQERQRSEEGDDRLVDRVETDGAAGHCDDRRRRRPPPTRAARADAAPTRPPMPSNATRRPVTGLPYPETTNWVRFATAEGSKRTQFGSARAWGVSSSTPGRTCGPRWDRRRAAAGRRRCRPRP